jgi:hypothetical protein
MITLGRYAFGSPIMVGFATFERDLINVRSTIEG